MEKYINKTNTGTFKIRDTDYLGELKLSGKDSMLTIWSDNNATSVIQYNLPEQIHGLFNDLQKFTLLNLVSLGIRGFSKKADNGDYDSRHSGMIHPHYVLFGDRYVEADECCFEALEFVTSHSTTLFNDYGSFTRVINAKKEIIEKLLANDFVKSQELLEEIGHTISRSSRVVDIGDHPIISIYTGSDEICAFDSPLGRIEINNKPSQTTPSSRGFKVENKVTCTIRFSDLLNFKQANTKIGPLLYLFGLILGEQLDVTEFKLHALSSKEYPDTFDVYECNKYLTESDQESIYSHQRLICVESNKSEFQTVINTWLQRQDEWQDARWQFFESFNQTNYTTDRLIKVANLFDIIPEGAYGEKVELATEVAQAKSDCKKILKTLPLSAERNSMLQALGRLGTKSLKDKLQIRVGIINDTTSANLTNIKLVIDHSIDCRNYFVHGGAKIKKFDYYNNFGMICFFIDTLEFIYGVSELLDAGWDFENWRSRSPTGHTFYTYLCNYQENLIELQNLTKKP